MQRQRADREQPAPADVLEEQDGEEGRQQAADHDPGV
jgi:hypothetical protein